MGVTTKELCKLINTLAKGIKEKDVNAALDDEVKALVEEALREDRLGVVNDEHTVMLIVKGERLIWLLASMVNDQHRLAVPNESMLRYPETTLTHAEVFSVFGGDYLRPVFEFAKNFREVFIHMGEDSPLHLITNAGMELLVANRLSPDGGARELAMEISSLSL